MSKKSLRHLRWVLPAVMLCRANWNTAKKSLRAEFLRDWWTNGMERIQDLD